MFLVRTLTYFSSKRRTSTYFTSKRHKLCVVLVVEVVQHPHVLGVADKPVDRGEMFPLGELLVQPPEDLDDTEGSGGDRVGEITTWWGHTVKGH